MWNPKKLYFLGNIGLKKITIKFLHWHRGTPTVPEIFIILTLLDFQNRSSPENTDWSFFFKVSV